MHATRLMGADLDAAVAMASPGLVNEALLKRSFRVCELQGHALNWAAAEAAGIKVHLGSGTLFYLPRDPGRPRLSAYRTWDPCKNEIQLKKVLGQHAANQLSQQRDAVDMLREYITAKLGPEIELPRQIARRLALEHALRLIANQEQDDAAHDRPRQRG